MNLANTLYYFESCILVADSEMSDSCNKRGLLLKSRPKHCQLMSIKFIMLVLLIILTVSVDSALENNLRGRHFTFVAFPVSIYSFFPLLKRILYFNQISFFAHKNFLFNWHFYFFLESTFRHSNSRAQWYFYLLRIVKKSSQLASGKIRFHVFFKNLNFKKIFRLLNLRWFERFFFSVYW